MERGAEAVAGLEGWGQLESHPGPRRKAADGGLHPALVASSLKLVQSPGSQAVPGAAPCSLWQQAKTAAPLGLEEKGTKEDKYWTGHHQLDGHEFQQVFGSW